MLYKMYTLHQPNGATLGQHHKVSPYLQTGRASLRAECVRHDARVQASVSGQGLDYDEQLVLGSEEVSLGELEGLAVLEPLDTGLGAARGHALQHCRLALLRLPVLHRLHEGWRLWKSTGV